jgi:N-acetylglucosamine kinase-like BadF-type ATPase
VYFVGVDGGTGDMEAVAVDAAGRVLGRGHSGPSNDPAVVGRMHPRVGDHLVEAIGQALRQAGLSADGLRAVSLNLSGDPEVLTLDNARSWLAPLGLPESCGLAVEDDGLSAWAAGGFPDPCIWVLLGTNCGSGGMLDGRKVEHPLGDLDLGAQRGLPIGGEKIGTLALSRAVHSQLGGRPTRLFDVCRDALRVPDLDGLIQWAREHTTADDRATVAKAAAEAAAAGDQVARELFERAGERAGQATVAMGHYMGMADRPVTILLSGKAWRAGEMLLKRFRETTLAGLPKAELRINELSQAQGAALLAMQHAGLQPGPKVYATARAAN